MGDYTRSSYHSRQPPWRRGFSKYGSYIGVELEVESRSSYNEVLRLLPNFPARLRPVTETDASLGYGSGVEIVFPPFLSSTMKRKTSVLAKSMEAISPTMRRASNAGLHLNVNTRGWSGVEKSKLVALIHNLPRTYLVNIGQRNLTRYCQQAGGFPLSDYATMSGHNRAAQNASDNRVELRFPVATSDHTRFIDLLEFVEYAIHFSRYKWKTGDGSWPNYVDMTSQFNAYMDKVPKRRRILEILLNGYS